MTDKELLELAAKAAEIEVEDFIANRCYVFNQNTGTSGNLWNPLTDDGDALRLAVKLGIEIHHGFDDGEIVMGAWFQETSGKPQRFEIERIGDDPYAATRRAIVRAAAEIGKASSNAE